MSRKRPGVWVVLAVFGGLLAGPLAPENAAAHILFKRLGHGEPPSACPAPPPPTQFSNGCLTVEIVGERFDTVEAYYRDSAYRVTIERASNLHLHGVFLAPGPDGLFVVRHGDADDNFLAVGWKGAETVRVTRDSKYRLGTQLHPLPLLGNVPIHIAWKGARVVRLTRQVAGGEQTYLLRWDQDNTQWQFLTPADPSHPAELVWAPLTNRNP
jgi:hypothetical protein